MNALDLGVRIARQEAQHIVGDFALLERVIRTRRLRYGGTVSHPAGDTKNALVHWRVHWNVSVEKSIYIQLDRCRALWPCAGGARRDAR